MTDNPCNCETCEHHHLVGRIPDIDECDILDHTPTEADKKLIKQIGCLLHPKVREYLMRDVIEELERRAKLFDKTETANPFAFATREAITIIKEGVKK